MSRMKESASGFDGRARSVLARSGSEDGRATRTPTNRGGASLDAPPLN